MTKQKDKKSERALYAHSQRPQGSSSDEGGLEKRNDTPYEQLSEKKDSRYPISEESKRIIKETYGFEHTLLNEYLRKMAEVKLATDKMTYPERREFLRSHSDHYLREKLKTNYSDFFAQTPPESSEDEAYATRRIDLKRSLFRARAELYLTTLDVLEETTSTDQLLEELRMADVPLIKESSGKEPTLEAIYARLKLVKSLE